MIYFDNSATTKPYDEVLDAFIKISRNFFANPSSLHQLGSHADSLIGQARKQIAQLLKVNMNEVFFTSGGTEGNNLAIKGTALQYRNRGKHIITTATEHPSIYETCRQLEDMGYQVTYLPVNKDGQISLGDLEAAITNETILVTLMHVNNEVGTIQPVREIGEMLKNYPKVLFHVDHVQGMGKIPLDLHKANIDFCTISAHKFHGLKGNGILYIREGVRISPLLSGGNQEGRMRSGTENTGGIVTMAKALRLIEDRRVSEVESLLAIRNELLKQLNGIPAIQIHTNPDVSAPHIVNFSVVGLKGEVMVHALEEEGIYVSTTSACSSKQKSLSRTLLEMGVSKHVAEGAVRVSLSYGNTLKEAEQFIRALKNVLGKYRDVMRDGK
ncbi:cysteine desulfurase family protein [Heyndrickxia acidicola]|uniref:Cysteine desulfurase family protein n=1 Tax=Heyndrickxia acidicola TaxID=209389 RepID=A0ABU6MEV0_9BACI|nr:cysteine desulfurase family protein [Heyndrickxia acidicola]MED1203183.1 cysteine desulfurase family protein [Heyndrickxia acidicola]